MKKFLLILMFIMITGCAGSGPFTEKDIEHFQPPIVTDEYPDIPLGIYTLYNNVQMVGLDPMKPIIPSYGNKGKLLASWNPHPSGSANRTTIVMVHGGHGLVPNDFQNAIWAQKQLGANVLVLDSFWSRGVQENWKTYTRFGVNMRMLDAIAAAQWLRLQDIDKDKIFLMGGSQGGWTALRTATNEPFMQENVKGLYRAAISLYPVCTSSGTYDDPKLGPYIIPAIVFTGGKDTGTDYRRCPADVFNSATKWIHYKDATHAWDSANRGAGRDPVDKECSRANNIYNRFAICRDNTATEDMYEKIKAFVLETLKH